MPCAPIYGFPMHTGPAVKLWHFLQVETLVHIVHLAHILLGRERGASEGVHYSGTKHLPGVAKDLQGCQWESPIPSDVVLAGAP